MSLLGDAISAAQTLIQNEYPIEPITFAKRDISVEDFQTEDFPLCVLLAEQDTESESLTLAQIRTTYALSGSFVRTNAAQKVTAAEVEKIEDDLDRIVSAIHADPTSLVDRVTYGDIVYASARRVSVIHSVDDRYVVGVFRIEIPVVSSRS